MGQWRASLLGGSENGQKGISTFSTRKKEVKPEASSVIQWPSAILFRVLSWICVLNLTLLCQREREKGGEKIELCNQSETDCEAPGSHTQKLFLIGMLIITTVNHLLITYKV